MDSVGELVIFDCSNNDLMTLDVSQYRPFQIYGEQMSPHSLQFGYSTNLAMLINTLLRNAESGEDSLHRTE